MQTVELACLPTLFFFLKNGFVQFILGMGMGLYS